MREVVMHTLEPSSTREATERMVKILDINYAKADLKQVDDNTTQLNYEERTLLLSLIENLEEFFDGTLGDWATEPVNLELEPDSKPINIRYYIIPIINKEKFERNLNV